MFLADAASLHAVVQHLDRLHGRFVSAILVRPPHDAASLVDEMLKPIGEALSNDHTAFEGAADAGSCRVPQVWTRRGSNVMSEAALTMPVIAAGRRLGARSVGLSCDSRPWPAVVGDRLQALAGLLALAERFGHAPRRLANASAPRPLPLIEAAGVDRADPDAAGFEGIVGDSPAMRAALKRVLEVSATDASVVMVGQTGTGKELFARALHRRSRRRAQPFIRVNCAALPPTLIESELFGHERGAFTAAAATRRGCFELAHHGTLFLDEIGDVPTDVQAKLLRLMQEGEFERVGSSESRRVDVRIVATLQQRSWPGNVRELENAIERAMIHSTGDTLLLDEEPGPRPRSAPDGHMLEHLERRHIEDALRRCRWRINGPGNAADVLGLRQNTLRSRMKKLGVQRPGPFGMFVDAGRVPA
jgi:transcriptional regulator with GAF, ATPase, and Fis domain